MNHIWPAAVQKRVSPRIDDLSVRARVHNCLKARKLESVKDILGFRASELLRIPNFGQKSLVELKTALADFGFQLENGPARPERTMSLAMRSL